jgi:hypothetical protein
MSRSSGVGSLGSSAAVAPPFLILASAVVDLCVVVVLVVGGAVAGAAATAPGFLAFDADVLAVGAAVCFGGFVAVFFAASWLWLGLRLLFGAGFAGPVLGPVVEPGPAVLVSVLPLSWLGEAVLDGGVGGRAFPHM